MKKPRKVVRFLKEQVSMGRKSKTAEEVFKNQLIILYSFFQARVFRMSM